MCINICEDNSGSGFLLRRRPEEGAVAQYQTQKHVSIFWRKNMLCSKGYTNKEQMQKNLHILFPQ